MSEELLSTENCNVFLPDNPAANGHVVVSPKREVKFLNELSLEELNETFTLANTFAALLFEILEAHGTNIIVNEDGKQLSLNIIARFQDDNLNLKWDPKKLSQGESDEAKNKISDRIDELLAGKLPEEKPKQEMVETKTEPEKKETPPEDNLLTRSQERIP